MHPFVPTAQHTWLDRYAMSQDQIQSLDERLIETFSAINNNDQDVQIAATVALIQMQAASSLMSQLE